jgi:hypothetical protein
VGPAATGRKSRMSPMKVNDYRALTDLTGKLKKRVVARKEIGCVCLKREGMDLTKRALFVAGAQTPLNSTLRREQVNTQFGEHYRLVAPT